MARIHEFYGLLANVSQQVDILIHETYEQWLILIEKLLTMIMSIDHHKCPVSSANENMGLRPYFHKDLEMMKKDGTKINHISSRHAGETPSVLKFSKRQSCIWSLSQHLLCDIIMFSLRKVNRSNTWELFLFEVENSNKLFNLWKSWPIQY